MEIIAITLGPEVLLSKQDGQAPTRGTSLHPRVGAEIKYARQAVLMVKNSGIAQTSPSSLDLEEVHRQVLAQAHVQVLAQVHAQVHAQVLQAAVVVAALLLPSSVAQSAERKVQVGRVILLNLKATRIFATVVLVAAVILFAVAAWTVEVAACATRIPATHSTNSTTMCGPCRLPRLTPKVRIHIVLLHT